LILVLTAVPYSITFLVNGALPQPATVFFDSNVGQWMVNTTPAADNPASRILAHYGSVAYVVAVVILYSGMKKK